MCPVACVRSSMIYWGETSAMNAEQQSRLERTEMCTLRWMCGVSLRRKTSDDLPNMLGMVLAVIGRGRLRWMGHNLRK